MDVETAIRARRTTKQFDGAGLARVEVEALLELGVWAPNHGRTEPWRFAVFRGSGLPRLAEAVDRAYAALAKPGADDDAAARLARKRQDMATRIRSAGAVVLVTADRHASPDTDLENYAAACCAVQNVLLGATGRGLASYWSTGRALRAAEVRALGELPPEEAARFVAAVFLGHAGAPRASTRTPAAERTQWVEA